MKRFAVLLAMLAAALPAFGEQIEICLAPIPAAAPGEKDLTSITAKNVAYEYEIQIGSDKYPQDPEKSQCGNYSNDKNILVVIRNNGQATESFYVQPGEFKNGACIWYKPSYATWSVWKLEESSHFCINRAQQIK